MGIQQFRGTVQLHAKLPYPVLHRFCSGFLTEFVVKGLNPEGIDYETGNQN